MNRLWLIGIPCVTVALAVYLVFLAHEQPALPNKPVVATQPLPGNESELQAEQERAAQLEQQLTTARVEAARNEQKARALEAELATNRSATTTGPQTQLPNLLKDPEMRQTMEKQQLQALERRIKQLVNGDLVAKLKLSPEEATRLRELLRSKQAPAMQLMTALMAGDLNETQRAAAGALVNQQIAEAEVEIRTLLGPERYSELERRENSDVERSQLRELKNQFSDAGHPLRSDQQEQLTAAMYDERQKFQFQINFHDPSSFDYTRFHDYFNEANLERFHTEMQELNARIAARAEPILDAEQLADFQRGLQEHLERGRATVRMTQALFPIKKP